MSGRDEILHCAWPLERLGEAIAALGAHSGIAAPAHEPPRVPPEAAGCEPDASRMLGRWINAAARWLGMDAESTTLPYSALPQQLADCAPALVRLPDPGPARFLAVAGRSRGRLSLLTPESGTRRVRREDIASVLRADKEATFAGRIDALLEHVELPARQRSRVRTALHDERLRLETFEGVWLLRPDPSASFAKQVKQAGLWRRLGALAIAHAVEYVCWILAWWLVGLGAMQGRMDRGWLLAWALLLLTMVPLRVATTWLQGTIAIAGGAILKQRLLVGALRMDPDRIAREGAGHLLGRVIESEAVESLALSGGFLALVSSVELLLAAAVLAAGAGGSLAVIGLAVWTALVLWIGGRYVARTNAWADVRVRLTHDLVERMIGHRTRVAQEVPERWHDGEDHDLDRYLDVSRQMDRPAAWLAAVGARGWLLLAVAAVAPSFVAGSATPAGLAVTVGGALLAHGALRRLSAGVWQLAEAAVAWRQVAPLFHAAAIADPPGTPELVVQGGRERAGTAVLQAHDLVFRHTSRPDPVLKGATLRIANGDRVWLEGASGAGKSTLASLLASVRVPDSGLLLAGGLDRPTLGGDGWRRRVASAPQFHENHVITGTFAFNLLMSRPDWPPSEQDVEAIEPLCRELGLDSLLARMPGGLAQMVGESGWQLSHGERSRLFLARALLQDANLVILDESFAALDPENLLRSAECVQKRARALLVIAHR